MNTYENITKSLIRSICQEFYDKLPSNMNVLKTLPVYAERLLKIIFQETPTPNKRSTTSTIFGKGLYPFIRIHVACIK